MLFKPEVPNANAYATTPGYTPTCRMQTPDANAIVMSQSKGKNAKRARKDASDSDAEAEPLTTPTLLINATDRHLDRAEAKARQVQKRLYDFAVKYADKKKKITAEQAESFSDGVLEIANALVETNTELRKALIAERQTPRQAHYNMPARVDAGVPTDVQAQGASPGSSAVVSEVRAFLDAYATKTEMRFTEVTKRLDAISSKTTSYANVLAKASTTPAQKTPKPAPRKPDAKKPASFALVVYAEDAEKPASATTKAFNDVVKFGVGVNYAPLRRKTLSHNKIRVDFETDAQRQEVIAKVNASGSLKAENAKQIRPLVLLQGITKDTDAADVIGLLVRQNASVKLAIGTTPEADAIKFRAKQDNRHNTNNYNALLEVDAGVLCAILKEGRMVVAHQRVNAKEQSPMKQCNACFGFGHFRAQCQAYAKNKKEICSQCAEEHTFKSCPNKKDASKTKCHSCATHNAKTPDADGQADAEMLDADAQVDGFRAQRHRKSRQLPTNHNAMSDACPQVRRMRLHIKSKTAQ